MATTVNPMCEVFPKGKPELVNLGQDLDPGFLNFESGYGFS